MASPSSDGGSQRPRRGLKAMTTTGALLVIMGILYFLAIEIVQLTNHLSVTYSGIYGSILYISVGSFGIATSKKPTDCKLIALLTIAVVTVVYIVIAETVTGIVDVIGCPFRQPTTCSFFVPLHITRGIWAFLTFACGLALSITSCVTVCCSPKDPAAPPPRQSVELVDTDGQAVRIEVESGNVNIIGPDKLYTVPIRGDSAPSYTPLRNHQQLRNLPSIPTDPPPHYSRYPEGDPYYSSIEETAMQRAADHQQQHDGIHPGGIRRDQIPSYLEVVGNSPPDIGEYLHPPEDASRPTSGDYVLPDNKT